MDREVGNKTEFEARNGQEMGNKMEFEMRNGRKWEKRQDKINNFSTKNKKNRGNKLEKQGEKHKKNMKNRRRKKTENYKKYRNKILTRFREMLKTETSFRRDYEKC